MSSHVALLLLLATAHAEPATMNIIAAGFGRTGTNSLKMALERLGHKTYHMQDAFMDLGQMSEWGRLARGEISHDSMLDSVAAWGYSAGCDFPISILYQDVLRRNPDAKVILTLREPAMKWATGFVETIGRSTYWGTKRPMTFLRPGYGDLNHWMWKMTGMPPDPDTLTISLDVAIAGYEAWKKSVIAAVPKEKLLLHEATDGWDPLCVFLEVDAASCPSALGEKYPHAPNDRAFMVRLDKIMRFVSDFFIVLCVIALGIAVAMLAFVRSSGKEKAE